MNQNSDPPQKKKKRWLSIFDPFSSGQGAFSRTISAVLLLALCYLVAAVPFGLVSYYSAFHRPVDQRPRQAEASEAKIAPGTVFTSTLIALGDQLLEEWLPNDVVAPTVFLDNPQNYQLGQLEVIRDSVRVLRDKLSRQRTTDKIEPLIDRAFAQFNISADSWILPSAEGSYENALEALREYRTRLTENKSHFYPRADNLIELLDQLASRLGGATQRLANAPRDRPERLSEETAGDRYSEGEKMTRVYVPRFKIDDHFYYARGVAYALGALLMAVDYEFREVLRIKRSHELLTNIIGELALADFEPLMVQNGGRGSIFANHSLTLMATLEAARQKILDLKTILEQ